MTFATYRGMRYRVRIIKPNGRVGVSLDLSPHGCVEKYVNLCELHDMDDTAWPLKAANDNVPGILNDVARRYGVTVDEFTRGLTRYSPPPPRRARREAIRILIDRGFTAREVGEFVGCRAPTVRATLKAAPSTAAKAAAKAGTNNTRAAA